MLSCVQHSVQESNLGNDVGLYPEDFFANLCCVNRPSWMSRRHTCVLHIRGDRRQRSVTGSVACVAEALYYSIGHGFGLSHWSFFLCPLPLSCDVLQSYKLG